MGILAIGALQGKGNVKEVQNRYGFVKREWRAEHVYGVRAARFYRALAIGCKIGEETCYLYRGEFWLAPKTMRNRTVEVAGLFFVRRRLSKYEQIIFELEELAAKILKRDEDDISNK